MEEELIRVYFDEARGWLLFMPDGNWNNKEKPDPVVVIEMPCKVVNVRPEMK